MTTDEKLLSIAAEIEPLLQSEQYEECIRRQLVHISENPEPEIQRVCYLGLANAKHALGDIPGAKLALTMLESFGNPDPGCGGLYVELLRARLLHSEERFTESKAVVERALDRENLDLDFDRDAYFELYELISSALSEMGDFRQAAFYSRKAYMHLLRNPPIEPKSVLVTNVMMRLADCLVDLGEYDEAETLLDNVLNLGSGITLSDAHVHLANICLGRRNAAGALNNLSISLTHAQYDLERQKNVLFAISDFYLAEKDFELAADFKKRAEALTQLQ